MESSSCSSLLDCWSRFILQVEELSIAIFKHRIQLCYYQAGMAAQIMLLKSPYGRSFAIEGVCSQLLNPDEPFCLKLEQRLVGGQANIITALGSRTAEPGALPSSQQQHRNFAL